MAWRIAVNQRSALAMHVAADGNEAKIFNVMKARLNGGIAYFSMSAIKPLSERKKHS